MKVVAVSGSPRINGASNTLLRQMIKGAKDAGHEVITYDINAINPKGCQACYACKNKDTDCVVADGLQPYWKDLHDCGALILAAPVYMGTLCGPMISYANRHYCLLNGKFEVRVHPGIKVIGIFAQGAQDTQLYQKQFEWYLSDFERRNMQIVDTLIYSGKQELPENCELMKKAYDLGYHLC